MPDSAHPSRRMLLDGTKSAQQSSFAASPLPARLPMSDCSNTTRRIAVVVGMHRSGTSVLARALAALGFELGDDLLPPKQPDNPTGYWEDKAFVDFNDELLRELGCLWWDAGVDTDALDALANDAHWAGRADALVRDRFADRRLFALKDPRASRLLRFWQPVFKRCGVDDRYVLSVRNPLEIARSLGRRDLPFDAATSYLLTAEHLFAPLLELRGRDVFVVGYEPLLQAPRPALAALGRFLGVDECAASSARADEFCADFLARERRRERATRAEFEAERDAPRALKLLYRALLTRHGSAYAVPDDVAQSRSFLAWEALSFGLRFASGSDQRPPARKRVHELKHRLGEVEAELMRATGQVTNFEQAKAASDAAASELSERLRALERMLAASRDDAETLRRRIDELESERLQHEVHDSLVRRALEATQAEAQAAAARADALEQRLSDDAQRIAGLEQSLFAWEARATSAEQQARELDARCGLLHAEVARFWWIPRLRALRSSLRPTRAEAAVDRADADATTHPAIAALGRFFRYRRSQLVLVPAYQLETTRDGFRSLGDDPQFQVTSKTKRFAQGWCRLRYRAHASQAHLQPKLYVDTGDGFTEDSSIRLPFATGRDQAVFLRLPDVQAMRLDPCDSVCEFTFSDIDVTELGHLAIGVRAVLNVVTRLFSPPGAALRRIGSGLRLFRRHGFDAFRGQLERALADVPDYEEWVAMFDTPTAAKLRIHCDRVARLAHRPLVSIVLPVHDTPERLLRECVESVIAQTYPHWELCVADDASTLRHVARVLADFAASDPRIRVVTRSQNGHISAASNSALAIATGEFVALLDHDDVLAPHALSCMIERLQEGEYDLAYSDEDHIDEFGRRYEPFFKPDWNPELLHSVNYLCHLTLVRRSLVERAGGFRLGFEGAQDFDLFLRISRDLPAHRVAHVPRVLYHWRSVEGSTARSPGEKAYAESAGLAALREHVAAVDAHAVAMPGLLRTTYRVRWRLPEPTPLVSIIIPTRDRLDLLRQCLDSIRGRTVYPSYEIVIVDNESRQPETLAYLRDVQQSGNVRVLRYEGAFNFSAINNRAVAAAAGSVIALVNNDIEVIDGDWLDELVSHAVRPEIGAVGPKLLYRDRHIQHAGLVLGVHRVAGHAFKHLPGDEGGANGRAMMTQSVSALTGACLVVRKAVYEQVGGLDEVHLQVAFNDVDFCIKVSKAGYRNVYTPYARLYHYESASRGIDGSAERVARFNSEVDTMLDRWGETLENDPAYNPNLTVVDEDFSLAWPPRVRE